MNKMNTTALWVNGIGAVYDFGNCIFVLFRIFWVSSLKISPTTWVNGTIYPRRCYTIVDIKFKRGNFYSYYDGDIKKE